MTQLALDLEKKSRATPEEEHLFRRWQSGEGLKKLGAERGLSEVKMISIIAVIWRKFGPQ